MVLSPGFALIWAALFTVACVLVWTPGVRRFLGRIPHPVLVAVLVALLVRLPPAVLQPAPDALVTYDHDSYRAVAAAVAGGGDVYALPGRYPYLPLHLYLIAAAHTLAAVTGAPFLTLLKAPAVAADLALVAMLGAGVRAGGRSFGGVRAAWTYALCPVSVLVTAYHGQFDAIPTALLLGAWMALVARPRWCPIAALVLGLAIAEKTWPLALAPLFLPRLVAIRPESRRRPIGRAAAFMLVTAAPVALLLIAYEMRTSGGALRAVAAATHYWGYVGIWGYSGLMAQLAPPGEGQAAVALAASWGPWTLAAALMVALVAAGRLRHDVDRMALAVATLYAASAGWGAHWLLWLTPVALLTGRRWAGAYIALSGAYVAFVDLGFGVVWGFGALTGKVGPYQLLPRVQVALWFVLVAALLPIMGWLLMAPLGRRLVALVPRPRRVAPVLEETQSVA